MIRIVRFAVVSVFAAGLAASCEDHSGDASAGSAPSSASSASFSLSGTWSGRSATGQVSTELTLSESDGRVSGKLAWPGGYRSVSGTRSGNSVTLRIGGGDTWNLTLSGDSLHGTGYMAGGGTYSCTFTRRR